MTAILVALGAAVGAPVRYLADRSVQRRHTTAFPWGTWSVNVAGSFLLGLLAAGVSLRGVSTGVMLTLGTGFCGALTTYSTFGYETIRLAQHHSWRPALGNVVGSLVAGFVAALVGVGVAHVFWA